ncbi:hypothetical protein [Moorena sp. SIO4A5]|nr:hypothetical protein [Moorena sp. SIO4A5]NEO23557.1 hypothetical protein [Moorena sp. SIO4A5]
MMLRSNWLILWSKVLRLAIAQLVNFRVIAYRYFIVNLICRQQIFRGTL